MKHPIAPNKPSQSFNDPLVDIDEIDEQSAEEDHMAELNRELLAIAAAERERQNEQP